MTAGRYDILDLHSYVRCCIVDMEHVKDFLPLALNAVVLDCKDIAALADFYARLLGWEKLPSDHPDFRGIRSPAGMLIWMQRNDDYVPPVWPEEPGAQQQMVHMDFSVASSVQLELAVQHAIDCGAVKTETQFGGDHWITMLDPAGHPFCFVIG